LAAFQAHQQAAFVAEVAHWGAEASSAVVDEDPLAAEVDDSAHRVLAEISGSVWKVVVAEGAAVSAGQTLMVLEAMKMEFPVTAPSDGIVKTIHCRPGRSVDAGALLMTINLTEDLAAD